MPDWDYFSTPPYVSISDKHRDRARQVRERPSHNRPMIAYFPGTRIKINSVRKSAVHQLAPEPWSACAYAGPLSNNACALAVANGFEAGAHVARDRSLDLSYSSW